MQANTVISALGALAQEHRLAAFRLLVVAGPIEPACQAELLQTFQEAVRLLPRDARMANCLGITYAAAGRPDLAVPAYASSQVARERMTGPNDFALVPTFRLQNVYRQGADSWFIDNARRKQRLKHGANLVGDELHESRIAMAVPPEELLAVNDALAALALEDPQAAEVVQMRYFVGMSDPEIALALDIAEPAGLDLPAVASAKPALAPQPRELSE